MAYEQWRFPGQSSCRKKQKARNAERGTSMRQNDRDSQAMRRDAVQPTSGGGPNMPCAIQQSDNFHAWHELAGRGSRSATGENQTSKRNRSRNLQSPQTSPKFLSEISECTEQKPRVPKSQKKFLSENDDIYQRNPPSS